MDARTKTAATAIAFAVVIISILYLYLGSGAGQQPGNGGPNTIVVQTTTVAAANNTVKSFNISELINSSYFTSNKFTVLKQISQLPNMDVNSSNTALNLSINSSHVMALHGSGDTINVNLSQNALLVIEANQAGLNDTLKVNGGYVYNMAIPESGVRLTLINSTEVTP